MLVIYDDSYSFEKDFFYCFPQYNNLFHIWSILEGKNKKSFREELETFLETFTTLFFYDDTFLLTTKSNPLKKDIFNYFPDTVCLIPAVRL